MNEILAEIHKYIPRVFVNLILIGNVSEVYLIASIIICV